MRTILLCLLALHFTLAGANTSLDPLRPHLDKVAKRGKVRHAEFEYPFLLSQTAIKTERSSEALAAAVRSFLSQGKLPFPGHYAKEPISGSLSVELPHVVKSGTQLTGIEQCTVDDCKVKLNTTQEKTKLQQAKDKLGTYQSLVGQRLRDFLTKRELLGYEDRKDNREYVRKMLHEFEFFSKRYPVISKFFEKEFWNGEAAPASLVATTLRQEVVVLAPDRLQPIWRLGEVFEFAENGSWVFFELHFYSNHYMDSSIRILEVFPMGKQAVLVLTDIMEIDELTKSGLIRMLYKGKMEEAVAQAQSLDIQAILK